MPPKSQRSRACSQCRTRRVKCDETPETCNQCRRLGLKCSGPLQGSIVIDMTERIVKPKTRKKKETARVAAAAVGSGQSTASAIPNSVSSSASSKAVTPLDMPLQNAVFSADSRNAEEVEKALIAIRYHYRPPSFSQPSRVLPLALDNAFLTHYVELNVMEKTFAPELQWLGYLPSVFSAATKPAVRIAIRAVSMAFYGKTHQDSSILIDSWRWYTVALGAQRNSIAAMKKDDIPDEGEVLVPLIFSLYELYVGATSSGLATHLDAAGAIMKMRGPSNCKSGVIWPLFKAIRSQDAHRSMIFNRKSIYSSPEWLTTPFVDMPKDPHQHLADIHLMIPHCAAYLGIQGSLRVIFETPVPANVDTTPGRELGYKLIQDLDHWAKENPHLTKPFVARDTTPNSKSSPRSTKKKSPKLEASSATAAIISANYMADRVLLNMLLHKMHTESDISSMTHESSITHYFSEAQKYSQNILEFAAEVERAQKPGFDLLRSVVPVVIVSCAGPTIELRNEAKGMIYRWASKVSGLTSALERM